MATSNNTHCPNGCMQIHRDVDIEKQDLYHSRSFGLHDDGTPGVIEIGILQDGGKFTSPEILIDMLEMTTAHDLRDLARDCLEAADWMDANLPQHSETTNHD